MNLALMKIILQSIVLHMLEPISEYLTDGRKSVARINSTQVHHYGSYR